MADIVKVTKIGRRELSEKDKKFLEEYLISGSLKQAAIAIGYEKNPNQMGYYFKKKLYPFILANMREFISKMAPNALTTIYELAMNCEDPKIRFQAAKDILDRAGFKPATEHKISIEQMSDEEIDQELRRLLKKANVVDVQIVDDGGNDADSTG